MGETTEEELVETEGLEETRPESSNNPRCRLWDYVVTLVLDEWHI